MSVVDDYCSVPGVLYSSLEVSQVSSGPISTVIDEERRILYAASFFGRYCHVISNQLSQHISKAIPSKVSIEFNRPVQALCIEDDCSVLIVATQDGRLWHSSRPLSELQGRLSHQDCVEPMLPGQRLLGTSRISACHGFLNDGSRAWITSGTALSPPYLIVRSDTGVAESFEIQGLEFVNAPVSAVLFVQRERLDPLSWKSLTGTDHHLQSLGVILLGFGDGSVRTCVVGWNGSVDPARLIGNVDSTKQAIISILNISLKDQTLIVAMDSGGAVLILNNGAPFHTLNCGLPSGRRWTGAAPFRSENNSSPPVVSPFGHSGLVTTCIDGSVHAILLWHDLSWQKEVRAISWILPIRDTVALATCYEHSNPRTWMALSTLTGSIVFACLDSSSLDVASYLVDPTRKPPGPLQVVGQLQHPGDTSAARVGAILQGLTYLDAEKEKQSIELEKHNRELIEAKDRTRVVLEALHGSRNGQCDVLLEESQDDYTVVGGSLAKSSDGWVHSVHLIQNANDKAITSSPSVVYAGAAVTLSGPVDMAKDRLSVPRHHGFKSATAHVTLSQSSYNGRNRQVKETPERRKTNDVSAVCPSFVASDRDNADLVLSLKTQINYKESDA